MILLSNYIFNFSIIYIYKFIRLFFLLKKELDMQHSSSDIIQNITEEDW